MRCSSGFENARGELSRMSRNAQDASKFPPIPQPYFALSVVFSRTSAGLTRLLPPGILGLASSGSSSVVEHRLAKARVASSSLVSRSIPQCAFAIDSGRMRDGTIRDR